MATNKDETERKPFKDYFDKAAAQTLAKQFVGAYPTFDQAAFVKNATNGLANLEFNARIQHFAAALHDALPKDPNVSLRLLQKSLPDLIPDADAVTDGFAQWPLGQFIADYGLDADFDIAFEAMTELTQRFSSEFAIRPFMEAHPDACFNRLYQLTSHPNEHVRRWCSEGTRTRLPWGRKLHALIEDPTPIWPILEDLKDDPSLYVRRSVANNINDLAKDHSDDVVARLKTWKKSSNTNRDWLIKHGLRTLVKDGHPGALQLIGFGPVKNVQATLSLAPKKVAVGEKVAMTLTLNSSHTRTQDLMIDYAVHYVRKGNKTSDKVFKWSTQSLAAKEQQTLQKNHPMKVTTIRALYPGKHRIEVQINGERLADATFTLTEGRS